MKIGKKKGNRYKKKIQMENKEREKKEKCGKNWETGKREKKRETKKRK